MNRKGMYLIILNIILILFLTSFVSATWWDNSWSYKKQINVTTSDTTTRANVSALINVTYNAHMMSNFTDLRFTDSSEVTELYYWFDNNTYFSGSSVQVWVKLPSNISSSTPVQIYMYYGNSAASFKSNISNAFIFGDDFNSAIDWNNKWQSSNQALYSVTNTGYLNISGTGTTSNPNGAISTNKSYTDVIMRARYRRVDCTGTCAGGHSSDVRMEFTPTPSYWNGGVDTISLGDGALNIYIGGTNTNVGDLSLEWFYGEFTLFSSRAANATIKQESGTVKLSKTGTCTNTYVYPSFWNYLAGRYSLVDYVFVRGVISDYPASAFGSETANSGSPPLSIQVALNAPSNNTLTSLVTQSFNSTITPTSGNITNATLSIWNSTNDLYYRTTSSFNSATALNVSFAKTLTDDTYHWNVRSCATNSTSYLCANNNTNYTIQIYSAPPIVNISYPSNTSYVINVTSLNFSTSFPFGLTSCWFNNGSSILNTTINCSLNITGLKSNQGSNTWTIFANSTLNTIGNYSVTFFLNSVSTPHVYITYPIIGTNYSINHTALNFTFVENNPDSCWYNVNGTSNSSSIKPCINYTNIPLSQGTNTIIVYINNTGGTIGFNSTSVFVDSIPPIINLTYPLHSDWNFASNINYFNYSVYDNIVGLINSTIRFYNLSNSLVFINTTNHNGDFSSNITTLITLPDGIYNWSVTSFNIFNNEGTSSNFTFNIDTQSPALNIQYPLDAANYSIDVVQLNFTIDHPNGTLSSCWYTTSNGSINITVSCNITASFQNITVSVNSTQGNNIWSVYANDTSNNIGKHTHTFFVDSKQPILTLINPINNSHLNNQSVMNFTANVSDTGTGITNVGFTIYNNTGTVYSQTFNYSGDNFILIGSQVVLNNGEYVWYYNATDGVGNVGFSEKRRIVWGLPPIITWYSPTNNTYTNSTPFPIKVQVLDLSLDSFNATLTNSTGSVTFSNITSNINSSYAAVNITSNLVLSVGNNTLKVCAIDEGSLFTCGSYIIFYDPYAPNVTLISPVNNTANNTFVNTPINLTYNVTDIFNSNIGSGIANTSLTVTTNKCYQEFANVSSCGQSIPGNYLLNNTVNSSWFDGNITTYINDETTVFVNYTIPAQASRVGSFWVVYDFTNTTGGNWSVPSSCWDTVNMRIQFKIYRYNTTNNLMSYSCYNITNGNYFLIKQQLLGSPPNFFYEEAMNWNMGTVITTNGTSLPNLYNAIIGIPLNLIDGVYYWFADAYDNAGNHYISPTNTFTINSVPPAVNIIYPLNFTNRINYNFQNYVATTINWTFNESNPINCSYYIDNPLNAVSVNCSTFFAPINITYFPGTSYATRTLYFSLTNLANHTSTANVTSTWTADIYEVNKTFASSTYETDNQNFGINISYDNTLYNSVTASLVLQSTYYPTTSTINGSSVSFTTNLDIPTIVGNQFNESFYWVFNLTNSSQTDVINTNLNNITVNAINFNLCNSSNNVTYLNTTFRDEINNTAIAQSINGMTLNYYLGSGSSNKSFSFSNPAELINDSFCFSPADRNVVVSPFSISYTGGSYGLRSYNSNMLNLTNTTTNLLLYNVANNPGAYTAIYVTNQNNQVLQGAVISMERTIFGSSFTMQEITDATGIGSFWVNTNQFYTVTISDTGCNSSVFALRPTLPTYQFQLACGNVTQNVTQNFNFPYVAPTVTIMDGVTYRRSPTSGVIRQGPNFFEYRVDSFIYNITSIRMELVRGGILLASATAVPGNPNCNLTTCYVNLTFNVPMNNTAIKGRFLVDFGRGYLALEQDAQWRTTIVTNLNTTTIKNFFNDLYHASDYANADGVNDQNRAEYSRLVMIFLLLAIILAFFNRVSGYDAANPGAFLTILTLIILVGSLAGGIGTCSITTNTCTGGEGFFFFSNFIQPPYNVAHPGLWDSGALMSAAHFINNYILALYMILILGGYFLSVSRRQS